LNQTRCGDEDYERMIIFACMMLSDLCWGGDT
jgi:hypothetical protein